MRKMPIGIQDFEKVRTEDCVYVDKTALVYRLVTEGNPYFLGRPRRFGKSLLVSTLKAYFLGKKELFEGLAIAELEREWTAYPVFHIDLTGVNYTDLEALKSGLDDNLQPLEEVWGRDTEGKPPASRFLWLIRRVYEKTGKRVVVLIDEYDKPLLDTMDDPHLHDHVHAELRAFYGVLKRSDPYLRFALLTGVTKFSKVRVFSDLNHLRDISMEDGYADLCGISASELTGCFQPELHTLAEKNGMTYDEALAEMQKRYNGYHFSRRGEGMCNPFSVLNTFAKADFDYSWFQTGTPAFLVKMLKDVDFDLRDFSRGITLDAGSLTDYRVGSSDPTPLLYQSGYLTIKGYDPRYMRYTLGFPNGEVEYGFLKALLPAYIPVTKDPQGFFIGRFNDDLEAGDVDAFMTRLRALFGDIPYELNDKTEGHYQVIFYLVFKLMGQFVQAEVRSAKGRADAVVETRDRVYVFEFKLDTNSTAEDALVQIDERGYLIPYTAGDRKLVKIGVEFDPVERTIGRWLENSK
ncbi:MAG: ATP-binding protein [Treponema sp.]|jgi:hypothetical protein|nr:ATP-binding protein [Treponema sp.]